MTMLCAKNDDAGLVLPQLYALGTIPFATIVNSKDIIAREFKIPESNNRIKNVVFPFYKSIKRGSGGQEVRTGGSSSYSLLAILTIKSLNPILPS